MKPIDGVVLLDKPTGISSFKALRPVKKALAGSKVGHSGTLDPFASGLLVVLTGRMTRIASKMTGMNKTYEAVFRFGEETDTGDTEGTTTRTAEVPALEGIEQRLSGFRGAVRQQPPEYSAVHVNGRRAYERARDGEQVDVPYRDVYIEEFSVLSWHPPDLHVRVRVSSGTYIRALARDLGRACDSCAYVTALRRTEVGPFSVEDAIDVQALDELRSDPESMNPQDFVFTPAEVIPKMPGIGTATVCESAVPKVQNGMPLNTSILTDDILSRTGEEDVALFSPDNRLLAVAAPFEGKLTYRFVCAP